VPTLIIWGRHDAIIPLGHGRLAHAALPGSELEIFDEAGHFPHHTDPRRFVEVVHEFMERTTPARFDREDWRVRMLRGTRAGVAGGLAQAEAMDTASAAAELTLL